MIGTNDLANGTDNDKIVENIREIISMIKDKDSNIKIYLETIYPINIDKRKNDKRRNNKDIRYINEKLKEYCVESDIVFIDVYSNLIDSNDKLKDEYTEDGLHLNNNGYEVVTSILKPYIER